MGGSADSQKFKEKWKAIIHHAAKYNLNSKL